MFDTSRHKHFDRQDDELEQRDKELKHLCRLVRDLELEARGRHRRRDHEERGEGSASMGGHHGVGSHQSGSHRHRDSISPKER